MQFYRREFWGCDVLVALSRLDDENVTFALVVRWPRLVSEKSFGHLAQIRRFVLPQRTQRAQSQALFTDFRIVFESPFWW